MPTLEVKGSKQESKIMLKAREQSEQMQKLEIERCSTHTEQTKSKRPSNPEAERQIRRPRNTPT